ncbi:hypothetical protein EJ571_01590 [Mycobacteroides franklinii]|uniref:Uncharacterized protein n=2 Tax=Mycobacteroides franklinii TaxID=948102 RepID=A0A4R5PG18_9MYCO|nr:hypothetical protein BST24_24960 [Mycobacteroides franklinii]TDH25330.1 hypothetical protein EJ571_01590 [Mycobacteroides franklinii]
MWAYVTKAPPLTAIHHDRTEGMSIEAQIGAELLNEIAELHWRYAAVHFKGRADLPIPERLTLRELIHGVEEVEPVDWEPAIDTLTSPEFRAMLQGG